MMCEDFAEDCEDGNAYDNGNTYDDGNGLDGDVDPYSVYISFPKNRPSHEEIMALHPGIVDVEYPDDTNTKFCYLKFDNRFMANDARLILKDSGYVNVALRKVFNMRIETGYRQKIQLLELPPGTISEDLKAVFPNCKAARIKPNNTAMLVFSTDQEGEEAVRDRALHYVNGAPIRVSFLPRHTAISGVRKGRLQNRMKRKITAGLKMARKNQDEAGILNAQMMRAQMKVENINRHVNACARQRERKVLKKQRKQEKKQLKKETKKMQSQAMKT